MGAAEKQKIEQEYRDKRLPSEEGVVVEPASKSSESFIPKEAIEASEEGRTCRCPEDCDAHDRYSEDKVAKNQPPVDSSEETLGG